jgi:hypothetical protein
MTDNSGFGRADVARCWAGFASLGAGLVHLGVVREHLEEWWIFGVFFAVVGAAQICWALMALSADRAPFPRFVVGANIALVALWATTRTVGIPIGPERWAPEAAGRADVLCIVLELATLVALTVAARGVRRPLVTSVGRSRGAGRSVALLFAGALAVSAVTTPALAATESGQHSPGMHM